MGPKRPNVTFSNRHVAGDGTLRHECESVSSVSANSACKSEARCPRRRNLSQNKTRTKGPRVQRRVPQSGACRGTPARALPPEWYRAVWRQAITVGRREGKKGRRASISLQCRLSGSAGDPVRAERLVCSTCLQLRVSASLPQHRLRLWSMSLLKCGSVAI